MFKNLPDRKYPIIYMDPPWKYRNTGLSSGEGTSKWKKSYYGGLPGSVEKHYPTLSIEELATLPIKDLCEENCLVFVWTTSPLMKECFDLFNLWGFTYGTVGFVWLKKHTTPGIYTKGLCEYCLIFKLGAIPTPRGRRDQDQVIVCPQGRHSEKPPEAKKRTTLMFPTQRKLEMFARPPAPGLFPEAEDPLWDYWGNEV